MKPAKYKSVILDDGRLAYDVAGMVTVYDEQEAIDLTQTGVFKLNCELTRSLLSGPKHLTRTATVQDEVSGMPKVIVENYEAA